MKFNLSYNELWKFERSVYSQGGQDGVLEAIFNQIEIKDGVAVGFGERDGIELSNTANLRINHNWKCLLMDSQPLSNIVVKEHITPNNINDILLKRRCFFIDYLSLDIDGNDFWVWKAMKEDALVVSIEYNSKFYNDESFAIEYNHNHKWEGDDYYGASLLALKKLGEQKGYTLVYVVDRFDAIFIRNDLISQDYVPPTLDELLPEPIIAHEKKSNKLWVIV